jgi:hypothetical protein
MDKNEMGGALGTSEGRGQVYTGFWWGDPTLDGRIILRWVFRKWDVRVWTGSSWLRIGTGGGHL